MLTPYPNLSIIEPSLPYETIRIGVLKINGISRKHAVFLCAKSQFFMLGWVRQSKDWLGSLIPVRQSYSVRLHNWRYVVGFKTLSTEAIMPKKHTQKPTNNVSLKNQSRFNVITNTGRCIVRKIPFSTAIKLKINHPELSIKFDSMDGVA